VWDGTRFSGADVLVYSDTDSGWNDELTLVHEAEGGEGDHPIDVASRALALESLQRHLPSGRGVVLDAGCSSGFLLRDLVATMPAVSPIGADFIAGPLRRLAPRLPGVPLIQFDLRASPFPDQCLDAVVCLNVLEHIDRDEVALAEIARMLRPGGIAYIEVPAGPQYYDIYDEYLMHHRRYTSEELLRKGAAAGLRVISHSHLGALVYPGFAFVKRRNRRLLSLPQAEKAALAQKMMRETRRSAVMAFAIRLELALGRMIRYPAGIRCVATFRKP